MADFVLLAGTGLKWLGFFASPLLLLPLVVLAFPGGTGSAAKRLARMIDTLSEAALKVAFAGALLMLFAQIAVLVLDKTFGLAFSWLSEAVLYGFAIMFLFASASALRDNDHVRVDILRARFSPGSRAGIELAGLYLCLFPLCILILWAAISPSFIRAWASFEASRESDGLPLLFVFRTFIPAFAVLLIVQGLAQALKSALVLRGRLEERALHAIAGGP